MNIDEIIDKLQLALELCGDGGPTPFTTEEYKEMHNFLEAQRMPEHGCHQWCRGKEPRWKVGDTLAYYECYNDYEGEVLYGTVTKIELDEYADDWIYCFDDNYWESEECMLDNETYRKNVK